MCKITSYQTGGAYWLFEVVTPPGGLPPHVQNREDEAFWVLEVGRLRVRELVVEQERTPRQGASASSS